MQPRIPCLLPLLAILMMNVNETAAQNEGKQAVEYAIVLHGGAGSSAKELTEHAKAGRIAAMKKAILAGKEILAAGGTSLDAVEQVVRMLEDEPLFNAGKGAVFNSAGGHELDASIMSGKDRSCGAVAGVRTVKNPISLARLVMTRTRHVLLQGNGAEKFADEVNVQRVDQQYFWTEDAFQRWERAKKQQVADDHKGTVGCVALDKHGDLAAATSTGGITNKKFGRVGDSPIVGAGTYADNATCGVSCTGVGEHYIRNAIAFDVSARMAYKGETVTEAVHHVLHHVLKPGDGGVIALGRDGTIVMDYNTGGMSSAAADSTGKLVVTLGKDQ